MSLKAFFNMIFFCKWALFVLNNISWFFFFQLWFGEGVWGGVCVCLLLKVSSLKFCKTMETSKCSEKWIAERDGCFSVRDLDDFVKRRQKSYNWYFLYTLMKCMLRPLQTRRVCEAQMPPKRPFSEKCNLYIWPWSLQMTLTLMPADDEMCLHNKYEPCK